MNIKSLESYFAGVRAVGFETAASLLHLLNETEKKVTELFARLLPAASSEASKNELDVPELGVRQGTKVGPNGFHGHVVITGKLAGKLERPAVTEEAAESVPETHVIITKKLDKPSTVNSSTFKGKDGAGTRKVEGFPPKTGSVEETTGTSDVDRSKNFKGKDGAGIRNVKGSAKKDSVSS